MTRKLSSESLLSLKECLSDKIPLAGNINQSDSDYLENKYIEGGCYNEKNKLVIIYVVEITNAKKLGFLSVGVSFMNPDFEYFSSPSYKKTFPFSENVNIIATWIIKSIRKKKEFKNKIKNICITG